jgi:hypothetical protein
VTGSKENAMSIATRCFPALFGVLVAAAGCTVEVEQRPVPRPPQACTFEYAPVCARRGRQERSFGNACMAEAEGYHILHRGQCRGHAGPDRPVACTREFAPVCAVRGSLAQTFDNACLARADGFRPLRPGRC